MNEKKTAEDPSSSERTSPQQSGAPAASPEPTRSRYYVSLDLGSDTMAAYFEPLSPDGAKMIPLQKYHDQFTTKTDAAETVLGGGDKPSDLMRTRIFLRDAFRSKYLQNGELQDSHAQMELIDPSGKSRDLADSIFIFFPSPFSQEHVMPNPKLVYQSGCKRALPLLKTADGEEIKVDPGILLKHLTTQVINSFILHSPELKNVPKRDLHLALTVPNVYSMTHAHELQTFVKDNVGVNKVTIVSESDALVYYLLSETASGPVRRFREEVVKPEERRELRIVTLDIGRGTTDLSLVQIRQGKERSMQHLTAARTGVCSGGQGLSYILANYYNQRLHLAFRACQLDPPRFDFIHFSTTFKQPQKAANGALEELIEKVKQTLDEKYHLQLPEPEQTQLLDKIVEKVKAARGEQKFSTEDDAKFREAIVSHFMLPSDLRNPSGRKPSWGERFGAAIRGKAKPDPAFSHYAQLVAKIEEYVRRNVHEMVKQLEICAGQYQQAQRGQSGEKTMSGVFDEKVTFVMIGGQASQFKPIQRAIYEVFSGRVPPSHILALQGIEAKTACAKGAIAQLRKRPAIVNPDAFFGTYGFLAAVAPVGRPGFVPVNSVEFMRTRSSTVTEVGMEDQHFIYVVRPVIPNDGYKPALFDGYTAMITTLSERKTADIEVKYDPENLCIMLDTQPVMAVSGHGHVNEAIQPKFWPVIIDTEDAGNLAQGVAG